MDRYERDAMDEGYRYVAGVDEAGRGPLAGPVVAAAVVFEKPPTGLGLRDSKKLTPKRRETLVLDIYSTALSVGLSIISAAEIDRTNILKASLFAMQEAVLSLRAPRVDSVHPFPDLVLVDGLCSLDIPTRQIAIKRGDSESLTIAAASIIAKTTRDRIMCAYDDIFPDYGFSNHKGYGTKDHIAALNAYGSSVIHRSSFSYT